MNSDYKTRLYFMMAKKKASELTDENDRIKAFKFIQLIEGVAQNNLKELRLHAIKLLLISMTANKLISPFDIAPRNNDFLSYDWAKYQPKNIVDEICREEMKNEIVNKPAVDINLSGDRREIVAYQEIPSFGAHFYFAYSPDPIEKWENLDKNLTR